MGLYDVFVSEEVCPVCLKRSEMEFQTKVLLNCLYHWRRGDAVETGELIVKDGRIKDCLASCPKCKASLIGDVVIENHRFVRVENLRERR